MNAPNPLVTVLFSLITLIIGIVLTYSFNTFQASKTLRLAKLEELYISLNHHINYYGTFIREEVNNAFTMTQPAGILVHEARDRLGNKDDDKDYATTVMLINVYFESLCPALERLEASKNATLACMRESFNDKVPATDYYHELVKLYESYNVASKELQQRVFFTASSINKEMPFLLHRMERINIMKDAISVILGAFGAVAGAYIIHFLTHNRWWREYRLRKLEELYVAVDNHVIVIDEYYTRRAALLDMDEKTATDVEQAKEDFKKVYFYELREDEKKASAILMIVDIYFDELLPAWNRLLDAKAALSIANKPAIAVEHALEHGNAVPEEMQNTIAKGVVYELLGKALPKLRETKTELLLKIVQEAEKVKGEKPWPFNSVELD